MYQNSCFSLLQNHLFQNLKYVSLICLTLQNSALILIMRYVRTRPGDLFLSSTAVVVTEILKVATCLIIIFLKETHGFKDFFKYLYGNIIAQPLDTLKVCVPGIVYTFQNNLLYVAVSNLDAATFQVTYQLKILTTAIFSVLMLKKQLSRIQWLSLVILFIGISLVQFQNVSTTSTTVAQAQNPIMGFVAVLISCMMSGFAGVYFEKILKNSPGTIWLRNVQLGLLGIVVGIITAFSKDSTLILENGFLFGYDILVWVVVFIQAFGGLMVAVVVKYADNILKGFATSASIIISLILSIFIFSFNISLLFFSGASLVIISVFLYSKYVKVPSVPSKV